MEQIEKRLFFEASRAKRSLGQPNVAQSSQRSQRETQRRANNCLSALDESIVAGASGLELPWGAIRQSPIQQKRSFGGSLLLPPFITQGAEL